MRLFFKIFLIISIGLTGPACLARAPKGNLVYCSYSNSKAGLGRNYCELFLNPGAEPRVNVMLHEGLVAIRSGDQPEIRMEYPLEPEDYGRVRKLQNWLKKKNVHKLNGYNLTPFRAGGTTYRIYMEYDSGDSVEAHWYGQGAEKKALAAYAYIEKFFEPWVDQAVIDGEPISECRITSTHTATRAFNSCYLLCQPGGVPVVALSLNEGGKEYYWQYDLVAESERDSIRALQQELVRMGAVSLGDYSNDEFIEGGTIYTVELVYPTGHRQMMRWHAREVDLKAEAVYDRINAFFAPWKAKARENMSLKADGISG